MRKLLILIFAVTFTACNAPAEQEGAGFFVPQPGEKFVVASDEVNDVWVKYIEAHNNRDMDAIRGLNSDSILVVAAATIVQLIDILRLWQTPNGIFTGQCHIKVLPVVKNG